MKLCYESVVIGVFLGALVLCILMLVVPKPTICEVTTGNNKESHVFVGVIKGESI